MSQVPAEHRATSPEKICCAVATVSDSRTLATDTGGQLLVDLLTAAGFEIAAREIIRDEPSIMRPLVERLRDDPTIDAVLLTGGTGISSRDQTYETISAC